MDSTEDLRSLYLQYLNLDSNKAVQHRCCAEGLHWSSYYLHQFQHDKTNPWLKA